MSAMPTDTEAEAIEAEARDWVLKLFKAPNDGVLAARCTAWRSRDPRYEAAFLAAERLWAGIGRTSVATSDDWRREAEQLEVAARRSLGGRLRATPWRVVVPTALAACLALAVFTPMALRAPQVQVITPKGGTRQVALVDGSHVFVGADSKIAVSFDQKSRRVNLARGEAFFEVAHDPSRPFTVVAGDAEVRVTGTKFDVKHVDGKVVVTVLEGRVEVRRHAILSVLHEAAPERVLTAGDLSQLADNAGFTPQVRVNPAEAGAWRAGRLSYADTPLADVIADANRYSATPIRLASPEVGEMRVTTSFRAGAVDQFVADLAQALPVQTAKDPDGTLVISARD